MPLQFLSVRDLRSRAAEVWTSLESNRELVVTHNGRPVAILSAVDEDTVEETVRAIRQARAVAAVNEMQQHALRTGLDRLTHEEIDEEIQAARQERRTANAR